MADVKDIPANERSVRIGGLMRCCLATLGECSDPLPIGATLSCKYESDPDNRNLILAADGTWEWNRPHSDQGGESRG